MIMFEIAVVDLDQTLSGRNSSQSRSGSNFTNAIGIQTMSVTLDMTTMDIASAFLLLLFFCCCFSLFADALDVSDGAAVVHTFFLSFLLLRLC